MLYHKPSIRLVRCYLTISRTGRTSALRRISGRDFSLVEHAVSFVYILSMNTEGLEH
ncbi:Uncharacterized protein DAT39_021106 [Clarias magur]|uniref:Uncharacterized protein n=1 Tax=Clarias magur TaxID=1594786 RepID=A0A8J4T755_CLAMG|nr:Uncharacterized protein DAT39_021106 [Clarias magur]